MGLNLDIEPPDEKTVRDFEKFLRRRHPEAGVSRLVLFHEHIVRLCKAADLVGEEATWVTDSTPMWCYGAVLDTTRLLGRGVGAVARRWAEGRRTTVEEVADRWDIDWILAPSIKGAFAIDWKDTQARSEVLGELVDKAVEIVETVRARLDEVRRGMRKKLLKLCRHLMKVVDQNLTVDADGCWQITQGVATGRIISITDPQARHGHKSSSKKFNGFKLHLLGDAVSGLIVSLAVTPGNEHDSQPAPRLIKRAKKLCDSMDRLLGDTAYGGAQLRERTQRLEGVKMIAPPPRGGDFEGLGKADFKLDLAKGEATCPNGEVSDDLAYVSYGSNGRRGPRFLWPKEVCSGCPLADQCKAPQKTGNSRMVFHPNEATLRELRAQWEQPETRQLYRKRTQGERLVNEAVRRGAREAMAWGIESAQLQAYVIAMVNNLSLLAKRLAAEDDDFPKVR
jgi:IS5 family transposase